MDEMKLESIKARIAHSDYEVDADAVAEAIVRRLLAAQRRDGAERPAPLGSGDVLEAG
jgi:hypothetical protein